MVCLWLDKESNHALVYLVLSRAHGCELPTPVWSVLGLPQPVHARGVATSAPFTDFAATAVDRNLSCTLAIPT